MTRFRFPKEAQQELLSCLEKLTECFSEEFEALLAFYPACGYHHLQTEEQANILAEKSGISEYSIWLLMLIHTAEHAKALFASCGADETVYWDTFEDFRYKLLECKEVNDIWGVTTKYWYTKFFFGELFKLGRLQFQKFQFRGEEPYTFGDYTVNPGDFVLNIHIPSSGEPFDLAARMDSYRRAYAFFKPEDGKPLAFVCSSWLIYPPYRNILSPDSNIVSFMDDFDILGQTDTPTFDNAWRLYGRDALKPTAELPEKTSMQRAIKKHLLAGGTSGYGTGIMLFDGEKILNAENR